MSKQYLVTCRCYNNMQQINFTTFQNMTFCLKWYTLKNLNRTLLFKIVALLLTINLWCSLSCKPMKNLFDQPHKNYNEVIKCIDTQSAI
jgi:hypothetical protein